MTLRVWCDTRGRGDNGMTPTVTGASASAVKVGADGHHGWMTAERCLGGRSSSAAPVRPGGDTWGKRQGGDGPSSWGQAPASTRRTVAPQCRPLGRVPPVTQAPPTDEVRWGACFRATTVAHVGPTPRTSGRHHERLFSPRHKTQHCCQSEKRKREKCSQNTGKSYSTGTYQHVVGRGELSSLVFGNFSFLVFDAPQRSDQRRRSVWAGAARAGGGNARGRALKQKEQRDAAGNTVPKDDARGGGTPAAYGHYFTLSAGAAWAPADASVRVDTCRTGDSVRERYVSPL